MEEKRFVEIVILKIIIDQIAWENVPRIIVNQSPLTREP